MTLQQRDIPLVIRLESDSVRSPERAADSLVLFKLSHHGPKAAIPIIEDIKETASSELLAFLDRVSHAESPINRGSLDRNIAHNDEGAGAFLHITQSDCGQFFMQFRPGLGVFYDRMAAFLGDALRGFFAGFWLHQGSGNAVLRY